MGNVHPYPRSLSREPSLHGHPAPLKKYGLLSTHPGCKSAIKGTVHLLLCHAKMLIPGRSLQPTNPSPLPCCSPQSATPPQGKHTLSQGSFRSLALQLFSPTSQSYGHMEGTDLSLGFGWMSCSPLPAQPVLPSLILISLPFP